MSLAQVGALNVTEQAPGVKRMLGMVADGETTMAAGFSRKFIDMHESKQLVGNSLVKVTNCQVSQVDGEPKIMLLDAQVVGMHEGADLFSSVGEPPRKKPAPASAVQPAGSLQPPVSPSECASPPLAVHCQRACMCLEFRSCSTCWAGRTTTGWYAMFPNEVPSRRKRSGNALQDANDAGAASGCGRVCIDHAGLCPRHARARHLAARRSPPAAAPPPPRRTPERPTAALQPAGRALQGLTRASCPQASAG